MQGLKQATAPQQQAPEDMPRGSFIDNEPEMIKQLPPEMQESYKRAYALSIIALYNEKFLPNVAKMIKTAQTPAAGIGRVAATIGARVFHAAKEKGADIPGEVMLLTGLDLVREIADYADEELSVPMSKELIEDAFMVAADNFKAAMKDGGPKVEADPQHYDDMVKAAGGERALDAMASRLKDAQTPQAVKDMKSRPSNGLDQGAV